MLAWRVDRQQVLVVGGGPVAAGRVRLALQADGQVRVVAPELGAELRRRHERGEIDWLPRPFADGDLDRAAMVMTAIDDPDESLRIAGLCRAARIPVNVADVPDLCDFWFTSVHREGPVQVAVSTNGQGPSIASRLIRSLADALPDGLGQAVQRFGQLRSAIRSADPAPESSPRRMQWLGQVGRNWTFSDLARLDEASVHRLVDRYAAGGPPPEPPLKQPVPEGAPEAAPADTVWMVGAGPGDPELLTLRAWNVLRGADLVVADRLVSPEILERIPGELRIARKLPGRSSAAQRELEGWVLEAATAGRRVVRLKQGDPFVFGRAAGELQRFTAAGLRVQVVPGLSSALCAPLAAGVPLTQRGVADRFVVGTGQGAHGSSVAVPPYQAQQTVVLLMAVGRASQIRESMRAAGYPEDLPVAAIERANQPGERVVTTELASLETTLTQARIQAPAVLVFGWVVSAAQTLGSSETPDRLEGLAS
jgi:uroporphyrin-III C-methyltransferase